ncbi:MAG: hypothetical protein HY650_15275 [Acidobacteria bacterium]|nr:hypothetical protein [Acidobacteriota bacterium]
MFHPCDKITVTILESDRAFPGPVEHRDLVVEFYDGVVLTVRVGERGDRFVVDTTSLYFIKAEPA